MALPRSVAFFAALAVGLFFLPSSPLALTSREIIELKQAGVEDETIELIIREQADLTGLINVREVIEMKAAGVSDSIIRPLASPRAQHPPVRRYGTQTDLLREISTKDLIRLKEAGFDDFLLEAVIRMQREELFPYLFNLGILACP